MSYGLTELGSRALNNYSSPSGDSDEAEYDRLRGLARAEGNKRSQCMQRSQEAYQSGDKAAAHTLSVEGKSHGAAMENYNKQARDFIFRANNADKAGDTIDLHGLYVDEAEEMLQARIQSATRQGDEGLHVIVGRGNHSVDHVRKLAPAVERICKAAGLKYKEEENLGRIYVWLRPGTGGEGVVPPGWGNQPQQHQQQNHQQQQQHSGHQQQQQQQNHHQQQQHSGQQQQQQQQQQPDLVEEMAKKVLPKVFKKLGQCCIIM